MSSVRSIAIGALVVLLAGGAGYLIYELYDRKSDVSFGDRINAAASAASDPGSDAPTEERNLAAKTSVEAVPKGTDGVDAPAEIPSATQPAPPRQLPALTLPDVEGKPRALSEWADRPLLINFWATWCEPCRREIPLLRQLRAEYSKNGLEVLGIAIDFRDAVKEYIGKAGIDYPVLVAEQDATAPKAFGVGLGLPTTVVADRDGRIVATHVGELHSEKAKELIAKAIGGG